VAAVAFSVGLCVGFGLLAAVTMENNNFWDVNVYSGRSSPTFRGKAQPPSSEILIKLSKQYASSRALLAAGFFMIALTIPQLRTFCLLV
jgi:hypothetical protein